MRCCVEGQIMYNKFIKFDPIKACRALFLQ